MSLSPSIVVPAYHEAATIDATLSSLNGQPGEVIVVFVGEETGDAARDHERTDRVIEDSAAAGPGVARNIGAEAADGDIVLFTDAETVVAPDWVETHREHYSDEQVVGVGGPVRPRSDSIKHRALFKLLSDYWYRASWQVGFYQLSGWNCSYRREPFLREGGFDDALPFMEDTELSLRIKKHGEVRYDETCWTATSVRRHERTGYLSLFSKYARAYTRHYVLDRDIEDEYFPSSDDVTANDVYDTKSVEQQR